MIITEETARELIAAINRLCAAFGVQEQKATRPKDPTGAERARRYRDRVKYRNTNGAKQSIEIIQID